METLKIGDAITVGIGFGTIGCILRVKDSEKHKGLYILTNGHVTANANGVITKGTSVYLGKAGEGSTLTEKVAGKVKIATVFKGLKEFNHKYGYVDWSLCKIVSNERIVVKNEVEIDGSHQLITKMTDATDDMRVVKEGARSGYTVGTVRESDFRGNVDYLDSYPQTVAAGKGVSSFIGRDFILRGDSGALIVEKGTGKAVSLIFGSDEVVNAYGIPIKRIFTSIQDKTLLDFEIAPNGDYIDGERVEVAAVEM